MTKMNAGIVGAGFISAYHIAAIRRLPGVNLVGICDLDQSRSEAVAAKYGIRAFGSIQELKAAGAHSLHILTPPHTHAEVAQAALNLGCHVFVEKPLTDDPSQCARLEDLSAKLNLRVCVGHSLLFDPYVQKVERLVKNGKIGEVRSVDIIRSSTYPPYSGGDLPPYMRAAGYPFRDLGVHALYLIRRFLGDIIKVDANWRSLGGEPNLAFDEWRATVDCEKGVGQFQLSWNTQPVQNLVIVQGTRGIVIADLLSRYLEFRKQLPLPGIVGRMVNVSGNAFNALFSVPGNAFGFAFGKILPYHGLQNLVAAYYRALSRGEDVPVSVADATPIVEWVERIARRADNEHRKRIDSYPRSESVDVVVTGASGRLGSAVVRKLLRQGLRVRVFVRRLPQGDVDDREIVVGNLGDPVSVENAIRGAGIVVHAGAAMHGNWESHHCATIVGTRNVLDACRKCGISKLVYISSLSVLDWAGYHQGEEITEESRLEPHPEKRGAYTQAKLAAEKLVSEYSHNYNLPIVILRPGQIFGCGAPLMTNAVARRVGNRRLVLGDGNQLLPLIHMEDVVKAVLLAIDAKLSAGAIVNLVAPLAISQQRILELRPGGTRSAIFVPRFLVLLVAGIFSFFFSCLGRRSPVSVYRFRSTMACLKFNCEKAGIALKWHPETNLEAEIVRCLKEELIG